MKVASESANVFICDLAAGGSLVEQRLPLGHHQSFFPEEPHSGYWAFRDDGLRIVVHGYNLLLSPNLTGIWTGLEQYADDSQPFIGVLVATEPLSAGDSWVGLKLGEHGARRIIRADAKGILTETDPFEPLSSWTGRWSFAGDQLQVDVQDRWFLTAQPWKPGIFLGTEESDEGRFGYVIVKAAVPG